MYKYYKNLKNNTKNPDLYKWGPVMFVKTDRNSKHLLEHGK